MYTFLLNEERCPECEAQLFGADTLVRENRVLSVNEGGRIVESISETGMDDDVDFALDDYAATFACAKCNAQVDVSPSYEEE